MSGAWGENGGMESMIEEKQLSFGYRKAHRYRGA